MNPDHLGAVRGPTATVLTALELLDRRRKAFEAAADDDETATRVIALARALLDDMEESLCEEDAGTTFLADGWRRLDELEARLADLQAPESAGDGASGHVEPLDRRAEKPDLDLSEAA